MPASTEFWFKICNICGRLVQLSGYQISGFIHFALLKGARQQQPPQGCCQLQWLEQMRQPPSLHEVRLTTGRGVRRERTWTDLKIWQARGPDAAVASKKRAKGAELRRAGGHHRRRRPSSKARIRRRAWPAVVCALVPALFCGRRRTCCSSPITLDGCCASNPVACVSKILCLQLIR